MMTESPQREIKKVEELVAGVMALLDTLDGQMPLIRDYYDDFVARGGGGDSDRPRTGTDGSSEEAGDGDPGASA